MSLYNKPKERVHRGFVYLDDDTVINSLSAVESGKIDEVVAKINTAREGGFGGKAGGSLAGATAALEGGRKSTSAFEEEMVRTRTRFSIFELWYQMLDEKKALGSFGGWGPDALEDVTPGDTVELRGSFQVVPLQTLLQLYRWFAEQAQNQNSVFAQKGDQLKETKASLRNIDTLLGGSAEILGTLTPDGQPGPTVTLALAQEWTIGAVGRLEGTYSVVAQVEQILKPGDEWPAVRLTSDAAATQLERNTLVKAVSGFVEPAKGLGIDLEPKAALIEGPALLLRPIAIYR